MLQIIIATFRIIVPSGLMALTHTKHTLWNKEQKSFKNIWQITSTDSFESLNGRKSYILTTKHCGVVLGINFDQLD